MKTNKTITKLVDSDTMILLETELEFLTDRINTQLEMIENLQAKLEAVEHELTDHRFNERVYDKMVDMVNEGHFKLLTDFYISDQ
ncbi:MAG: hypothetical protein CML19_00680 [Pusillimonas sp.]|nr:hypothetical protein [Pusillimonas sp.]|tara:strand:- start:342 stop:596 length:255 start_codon:yes stop_codon:yes gene_type:complete